MQIDSVNSLFTDNFGGSTAHQSKMSHLIVNCLLMYLIITYKYKKPS